jgi:hypothetical protein
LEYDNAVAIGNHGVHRLGRQDGIPRHVGEQRGCWAVVKGDRLSAEKTRPDESTKISNIKHGLCRVNSRN